MEVDVTAMLKKAKAPSFQLRLVTSGDNYGGIYGANPTRNGEEKQENGQDA